MQKLIYHKVIMPIQKNFDSFLFYYEVIIEFDGKKMYNYKFGSGMKKNNCITGGLHMNNNSNLRKGFSLRLLCASFFVVIVLSVVFTLTLLKFNMTQNVENRVFAELKSTSSMQASTLEHHLEDQYKPLQVIADMLENGETFASEEMQPMLASIVNMHRLCMLGFADMNGDAISYTGEKRSNLSDRSYFSDIVSGIAQKRCEYLAVTKTLNEPRVLFSIPAYQDGEMIGVLYCSKEVNVLEDSLFEHNELFNASSIIFICDTYGNMIVANATAHEKCLSVGADDKDCCVFEKVPNLKEMCINNATGRKIDLQGVNAYASLTPLEVNDWLLICIVDEATATAAYAKNIENIRKLTTSVMVIFTLAIAYIILLAYFFIRRNNRESRIIEGYYENYKMLFREMNCVVVEHDPTSNTLFSLNGINDPYGINMWNGSIDAYENYKKLHPEFDFSELKKEVELVRKSNKTCSFESIIAMDNHEIRWVKVILVPSTNDEGSTKIFGIVLDVSDVHSAFDKAAETFYQIPGGIHRCYLNTPIHLEYFSDGLCKMLGYTHEEVEKIITQDQRYSMLIHPDDRPIFHNFVHDLAENGGIQTCEYRMICKDGSLITVADTMDAKRSSSGIMYGYSIVTDLHKYKEMQEQLEQELQKTRQQLQDARIKNSNSQMQPHFLYNALASIREIVLDDPEYASDLIYDFTTHLRACIRSMASDNLVPFMQELENIKAYVNIEKMRFGDKLNIQYDCPETDFDIIPLSIQPLVENAIRHGIYERGKNGGTVIVRTQRNDSHFIIQVEDDGIGFNFEDTMQEVKNGKRDSTGLFNLIFRLETLLNATVSVKSQIDVGTKISIMIPTGGTQ